MANIISGTVAGALPNLIIIGAPKCGTTSLHIYLDAHQSISMSRIKEPNFFLDRGGTWHYGLDWYMTHFDPTAPVRGEASTNYASLPYSKGAAQRMKEIVPEAKLIYLVRDPFDRMASHYVQLKTLQSMQLPGGGIEERSFTEAALDPDGPYQAASLYATQLEAFLEHFDADKILVDSQERLLAERHLVLRRIFEFLGVTAEVDRPEYERLWEQTEGKGRTFQIAMRMAMRMRERGIHLPHSLRWPVQRVLRSWPFEGGAQVPKPQVPPQVRAALEPRLRDEAKRLRAITHMDFNEWSV
jgi:hypothetical protein